METTLLGLALPNVLKQIKDMLIRKGFIVQTMPTSNPVIVAYRKGSWLRRPRRLILEISSVQNNVTRIDITAIVNDRNRSQYAEEIFEENFTSALKNTFKKVIQTPYGI